MQRQPSKVASRQKAGRKRVWWPVVQAMMLSVVWSVEKASTALGHSVISASSGRMKTVPNLTIRCIITVTIAGNRLCRISYITFFPVVVIRHSECSVSAGSTYSRTVKTTF